MPPEVIVGSTQVIGTAITTFGVIVAAGFGYLGNRLAKVKSDVGQVKKDAAAARYQVENSHDTNLREESDTRHDEILSSISEARKDIGGIREEIRIDRKANADRFTNIEARFKES